MAKTKTDSLKPAGTVVPMAKHSQSPRADGSVTGPGLLASRLLLAVAAAIDGYLAWVSSSGGGVAGCGPTSNCHVVLNSKWAYWFGMPVSVPALLVYVVLLLVTLWLDPKTSPSQKRKAWQIVIPCSLAVLGAAGWFISLQLFVIKAICPYCMTAHGCGLIGTLLLLSKAPIREAPGKPRDAERQVFVLPKHAAQLGLGAVVGLAILVLGQTLHQPKTNVSTPIVAGFATNTITPTVREFQIFEGKFQFNLSEVPLLGRSEAPHTIVSLFDYTCHHCRAMHEPLLEVSHQFSNELAIISLPMPLDGKCNPIMTKTPPAHTNACALARLGLTVWLANRKVAPRFDEWMFAPPTPPQPEVAEAYARQLVGPAAFDNAATNAWVERQLKQDVALYEAVYRRFTKSAMPEVIIGTNLISGPVSRNELFHALSEQFGLQRVPSR